MFTRSSVYRRQAIAPFLSLACDRRVSVAMIGDSNQIHATNAGNGYGFRRAWSKRFPMWSGGVWCGNAQGGSGVDSYTCAGLGTFADAVDLPATHTQYQPALNSGFLYGHATYTGTPNTTDAGTANVLNVNGGDGAAQDGVVGSPLNITGTTINWHITYCTFATGGGVFYPCARQPFTATYFATYDTGVNCQTGVDGLADFTLAIPSDVNGYRVAHGLNGFYRRFDGSAISGKVSILWHQIENSSILNGVAVSTNLYQGGESTRDAVLAYRNCTMQSKMEWFRQLTYQQNGVPVALFHIIQGQNDTAENQLSLGPNPAVSSTYQGLVDNHEALILEIRKVWSALGYDLANLYFLIGPYHPQAVSRKQWIIDADKYLPTLADRYDNVAVALRNERYATTALFTANNWWETAPDAHLVSEAAYRGSADLAMQQIVPLPTVVFRGTTGQTLYANLLQGSLICDVTNGSLDVPLAANWTRYGLALTEMVAGSGIYSAQLPSTVPPGTYVVDVRVKAGGSQAVTDSAASGSILTPTVQVNGFSGTDPQVALADNGNEISTLTQNVRNHGAFGLTWPVNQIR